MKQSLLVVFLGSAMLMFVVASFLSCNDRLVSSPVVNEAPADAGEKAPTDAGEIVVQPGCADGTRELLKNMPKYPTVAGCAGFYLGGNLRNTRESQNCGATSSQECRVAEDLCAPGWHICMKNGDPNDLKNRLTGQDCANDGAGIFVAASSHCVIALPACTYGDLNLPCTQGGACSEPICCGTGCQFGLCPDSVWVAETRCARSNSFIGCGNSNSFSGDPIITGVLCCQD